MKYIIAGQEEKKEDEVVFTFRISHEGDVHVNCTHSDGSRDFVGYFDINNDGQFQEVDGVRSIK